ncbi:MAG: hypothetical protein WCN98_12095 [Verrucomicrobiaceae bacterium]
MAERIRFTKIDESNILDHSKLAEGDNCLFLYEYTPGGGFGVSRTNDLIINLKKRPSERLTKGGWQYKAWAINQCVTALQQALNPEWLKVATLVPVPSSKIPGDPDFDDRLEQVCRGLSTAVDVRSVVRQKVSTGRSHEAAPGARLSVQDLRNVYEINEQLVVPPPRQIGIFDDVLTEGTHFRAMSDILKQRFPGVPITGIFIARCVWAKPDFDF